MKSNQSVLLCATISWLSFGSPWFATSTAADSFYELKADKQIDEQLFLMRKLEILHNALPKDFADQDSTAAGLLAVRHELGRVKEYAQAKAMDHRLLSLYGDSIELIDHYCDMLIDLGAIDRKFARQLAKQNIEQAADGIVESLEAGGGMAVAGIEPVSATVLIGTLTIKRSFKAYQEREELNDEKALAAERRLHQFLIERSRLFGRIEVQASVVAEKLGWGADEIGFDQSPDEDQLVFDALSNRNYRLLRERADRLKRLRPRDPFVWAESGAVLAEEITQVTDEEGDERRVELLKSSVKHYLRAAELVPPGRFHDPLRADYLRKAAQSASLAVYFSSLPSSLPPRFANTALRYAPRDPGGHIERVRAIATARAGDTEAAVELIRQWGRLHGEDANFHYQQACLLNKNGESKDALNHLTMAWKLGLRDVRGMRLDRDLATLRRDLRNEFDKLTACSWSSQLKYGYVWNDFELTNNSDFPLTNIAVRASWHDQTAKFDEVYWIDQVPSATSVSISNAFREASMDKEHPPTLTIDLISDERRSVGPTKLKDALGSFAGVATRQRIDASNVIGTNGAQIEVSQIENEGLHVQIVADGVTSSYSATAIRDSRAKLNAQNGSEVGQIWFDGARLYGWYRSSDDPARDERVVFWCQREEFQFLTPR